MLREGIILATNIIKKWDFTQIVLNLSPENNGNQCINLSIIENTAAKDMTYWEYATT